MDEVEWDIISPSQDTNDHNEMNVKKVINNNNSNNNINDTSNQGGNNQIEQQTRGDKHRKKNFKTVLEGMCDFVTVIFGV